MAAEVRDRGRNMPLALILGTGGPAGIYGASVYPESQLGSHVLAFEGDGYVHWCEGNFQSYEQQRRSRLGLAGDQPQRFRYKRLKR